MGADSQFFQGVFPHREQRNGLVTGRESGIKEVFLTREKYQHFVRGDRKGTVEKNY